MRTLQLAPISGRRGLAPDAARWLATSLALHLLVLLPSLLGVAPRLTADELPTEQLIFLAPLLPRKVPSGDVAQQQDGVSGVPIHFGTFTESVIGAGAVAGPIVGRSSGTGTVLATADSALPVAPAADSASAGDENIYQAVDVDREVARDADGAAPIYPEPLRLTGVQGAATAEFVVDTLGRVEAGSFHIVGATHPLFAAAVRDASAGMRFRPAIRAGRAVRQQVLQNFQFKLEAAGQTPTRADTTRVPSPVVPSAATNDGRFTASRLSPLPARSAR